ncbi:MAG: acylphosphatase [Deferribacterales bacterium]
MKRYFITVKGRVQKVGFRAFVMDAAIRFGLKGYTKNLLNGDVFIDVVGDKDKIDCFIEEVKKGPALAIVKDLVIEEQSDFGSYRDFSIRY